MTSALRAFVRRLLLALRYSWQGLREGWRTQASLRYEITAAFLILPLAAWLGRTGVERALLIGSWLLVIAVELINSAIETVVDRIGSEPNELSGRAKDLGSAAVFCALVIAVTIWTLLCWEAVAELF
jgi:diacylglycerol kinase (ATP)